MAPGRMLGHENLGVVIEVGRGVDRIKVGDRVCLPFNIGCGFCANCEQGLSGFCLTCNPGMAGAAYGFAGMGPYSGGQAEFLRPEENCLACPREDAEALCGFLERLKNDPSLAERIALVGRELVLEEYTTSRYLRELEEFVVGSVKSDS